MKIFENTFATPRAFVAHDYVRVRDAASAIAQLRSGESVHFPDGSVQVARKDPVTTPVVELPAGTAVKRGTCSATNDHTTIVKYTASSVTVNVETECAGLLVLTDEFYPGWHASVNGESMPIHATDLAFAAWPFRPVAPR